MPTIELSEDDVKFLDKERKRLRSSYGVKLTSKQVLAAIIELHRIKLRSLPEQEDAANLLAWLRRRKDE